MDVRETVSTGFHGLDEILDSLRMGDNVVLQVTDISDYIKFVRPFVEDNLLSGRRVVYIRFASHRPIITEDPRVVVYQIDANNGFESFSTQVHEIIAAEGRDVFYVFDCLSDLLYIWATDLMIGNFFVITCPYLFELNTVAYFALLRNTNSFETITAIRETTQVLLDIYEVNGQTYVHPLKVWNRSTPTMFLPHKEKGERFIPLTTSADTSRLFTALSQHGFDSPSRNLDYWDRMFLNASDIYEKVKTGQIPPSEEKELVEKLTKNILSRDERFVALLTENFSLEDLLQIKSRLIGSGFIGGKAVGMLLARKILEKDPDTDYTELIEPHDSFYVGSDNFYSYLVQNGLWKLRMEQRKLENYSSMAVTLKEKLLNGVFSQDIRNQFLRMLEYFGQSPIIVRSSSLLEDGFGNSFAGKYESIFCINQGTLEERYTQFEQAVRKIFASTMNEDALMYRLKRGLADQDEQMALLVQRVSGCYRGQYFLPDFAGVGYSYNTYVWEKEMDPKAGMLRIVAGLGTRAVNRMAGDYARVIALDKPLSKPYSNIEDFKQYSQYKLDLLNVSANHMQSPTLQALIEEKIGLNLSLFAERDYSAEKRMKELQIKHRESWIITFDGLIATTSFAAMMHKMLKAIEKVYQYPVDIEFTVNFSDDNLYQINLLQCRPLQVKGLTSKVRFPKKPLPEKTLFEINDSFMGGNIQHNIQRVIFVDPTTYSSLNESGKYEVARTIGRINHMADKKDIAMLLIGPGRWGTSTPSLGVPVLFSEINNIAVLGEVAYPKAGYLPEVSFGTHFFQDLVESEIFYVALFPERDGVVFQTELLNKYENILPKLVPRKASLQDVIKVYDVDQHGATLQIIADTMKQKVICLFS